MTESKQAWEQVRNDAAGLGERLKRHYESRKEVGAAEGEQSRAELDRALQNLGDALENVFTSIGTVAKDQGIREDARKVSGSFMQALSATFAEVSEDLRTAAQRRRPRWSGEDRPPPESGSETTRPPGN